MEQFWKLYSHLVRPGDLIGHSDFHIFKEGIKPMWEVGRGRVLALSVCCGINCCKSVWYTLAFHRIPVAALSPVCIDVSVCINGPASSGWSKQERREVDHTVAEGAGLTLLGEHHSGHAGRAVHGGRGDLRCSGVYPFPGQTIGSFGEIGVKAGAWEVQGMGWVGGWVCHPTMCPQE